MAPVTAASAVATETAEATGAAVASNATSTSGTAHALVSGNIPAADGY
jgi:hypothetical protein